MFDHEIFGWLGHEKRLERYRPLKVAIVGAGIGGLATALELEKLGHAVEIFEQSGRIGGRLLGHSFSSGARAELGAMRIPERHQATIGLVRELGLETRPFINTNKAGYYYFNGRRQRIGSKPKSLYESFGINGQKLEAPHAEMSKLMRKSLSTFSADQRAEMHADRLESQNVIELDALSLREFLCRHAPADQVEVLLQATGLNEYADYSAKAGVIDAAGLYMNPKYHEIVGGMEAMVEGLVDRLAARPRLNTHVSEIDIRLGGAIVRAQRRGQAFEDTFDAVVVAVPPRAASKIAYQPGLPLAQKRALDGIVMASAHKTLIEVDKRFWEIDDRIAGGGTFTDLASQQIWYPSDNAIENANNPGYFEPKDRDVSHQPTALTAAYTWGNRAKNFASLTEEERTNTVLDDLTKVHGRSVLEHVTDIKHHIWDHVSGLGGGAFAYFASGQHRRYQEELVAPHGLYGDAPRVHFVGEHLGIKHAWIQPALESAARAVGAITALPR